MTFPPERQIDSHSHAHKGLNAAMCYFTKQQMLFFRPHTYLTSRDHPQSVRALHVLMKALHKHHILDSKNDHSRFDWFDLQSTLFRRNHTPLP